MVYNYCHYRYNLSIDILCYKYIQCRIDGSIIKDVMLLGFIHISINRAINRNKHNTRYKCIATPTDKNINFEINGCN